MIDLYLPGVGVQQFTELKPGSSFAFRVLSMSNPEVDIA